MIDVEVIEDEFAKFLQDAIWDELEKQTGQTKQDYDNQIVEKIVKFYRELHKEQ